MSANLHTNNPATPFPPPAPQRQPSPDKSATSAYTQDHRFWLTLTAGFLSLFLSAFDLVSVSTVLPVISHDLGSEISFVWIGSSYALSSTAFLTFSGQLSHVFGRRPVMLGCLAFFTAGSAVCGAAHNMTMMVIGRTIQGVGGGGVASMTSIVLSDLVPLSERAKFQGIYASIYAFAGGIGPVIGGAFAKKASWRWLFYLNLPICGIAIPLVAVYMRLPTPYGNLSLKQKLKKLDWIGNTMIVGSTASSIIGLTWGGVTFPWSSGQVLGTLIAGGCGLLAALVYELKFAAEPTIPPNLMKTRTAISGQLAIFAYAIVITTLVYYLPVYYQAVHLASPLRSGVILLSFVFTCPVCSVLAALSVKKIGLYRPQNLFAWSCAVIGLGIFCTIQVGDPISKPIGLSVLLGVGAGTLGATLIYPVLAPVPVEQQPHASALWVYVRTLASSWGIAIGGTVLQNQVGQHLPESISTILPAGQPVEYAIIPLLPSIDPITRQEVQGLFNDALRTIFEVTAAMAAFGLLTVFVSREIPLSRQVNEERTFKEKEKLSKLRVDGSRDA